MELLAVLALLVLFALLPVTASADAPITTITVTETADSPLSPSAKLTACESEAAGKGCTLRAAVELANEESVASGEVVTIDVPGDTFDDTLGVLSIEEGAQVVIVGAGASETIVDGGSVTDVFEVYEGASLTLQGLTVRHGHDYFGGGIYVSPYSSLTVEESTITENFAAVDGGGIYAEEGAALTIEASNVSDNETGGYGGGIDAGIGPAEECEESAAVGAQRSGRGGVDPRQESVPAVHAGSDAESISGEPGLTIRRSTIDDNTAKEGSGGGIDAWRQEACGEDLLGRGSAATSAKHLDLTTFGEEEPGLSIEQSTVAGNTAEDESDNDEEGGEGGGIFEEGSDVYDPIVNSTIADNVAQRNGGGVGAAYGSIAVLISDTVSGNTVVPPEVAAAKAVKPAVEELAGVGNNLAADESTYGLIERCRKL
jgi:predicted outer membrane repeat protein